MLDSTEAQQRRPEVRERAFMGMRLPYRLMSCASLGQKTNLRWSKGEFHALCGSGFAHDFPTVKQTSFPGLLAPNRLMQRFQKARSAFKDRSAFKSQMLSNDKTRRRYR
jgi:hypothetical protein